MPRITLDIVDSSRAEAPRDEGAPQLPRRQEATPMDTIRKADSRRGRIAYEVAGLAWLAAASGPGAAVVPMLDHGATWLEEPRLVSASPTLRAAEDFGRALAQTHAAGASHLGAPPPGFEGDGWMGEAHLEVSPGAPSTRASASPPTSTTAPSRPPNARSSKNSVSASSPACLTTASRASSKT